MPEQITKYPDVTMRVLESAGARCGDGPDRQTQEILTECPTESFCKLPGGEVCVYGIDQIPAMTQITTAELAEVVCPAEGATAAVLGTETANGVETADVLAFSGTFLVALVIGLVWGRKS